MSKYTYAFGYYGGKLSHLSRLLPLLPKCQTYVEPFGGRSGREMMREKIPEYIVWALVAVVIAVIGYAFVQGIGISQANQAAEFLKACKALNETLTDGQCQAISALAKRVTW